MASVDLNASVRGSLSLRAGKDLDCLGDLRDLDVAPKLPKHSIELHLGQSFEALIDLLVPFLAPAEHQKIVLFLGFFIDSGKLAQCLHLLLVRRFAMLE